MVKLADLLEDNACLHGVYGLLAGPDGRAGSVEDALRHVEALGRRTAHSPTREACHDVAAALATLGSGAAGDDPARLRLAARACEDAMRRPETPPRERGVLRLRSEFLRHRLESLAVSGEPAIPRVVHLIQTDPGAMDLPLFQYLCYRSILAHCEGYRVVLHAPARPRGVRWEKLLPALELDIGPTPQWIGDRRVVAAAHQSDAWRVRQLIAHGGFYFDWDLLLLRPPEGLRRHVCVMALEREVEGHHEVLGVSFVGARPGAGFLRAWRDAMPSVYNPRRYVAHSTLLARELAIALPFLVRVLDARAFYHPGWTEEAMRWLFDPAERLPPDELREHLAASTGIHLFCSHANFLRWAKDMSEKDIEMPRCNLAVLMQPYL